MKKNLLLLFFVIIVSIFPRIWELNKYPPIIVDEPAYLRDVESMILNNNYYPANFQWDGSQATLVYLPTILLLKTVIPNPLIALRSASIALSLLALIPLFFLTKKYTNGVVAFSSTIMFSYSYYFLQFSRVGWGVIYATVLGLYLLWVVDSIKDRRDFFKIVGAGIIAGLILYTYRAGEVYIIACFILLCIKIFTINKSLINSLPKILIFIIVFLLVSLPWIRKINSNLKFFSLRQEVVNINNVNTPYHGLTEKKDIMLYQIATSLKSWILFIPAQTTIPENQRYLSSEGTIVNPILIPFFISGAILAFLKFKKHYVWFLIYFGGLVFGQILTVDPPNGARGLIMLPIIYLFSSLSLFYFYNKVKNYYLLSNAIPIGAFAIAFSDFYFYINWMSWINV